MNANGKHTCTQLTAVGCWVFDACFAGAGEAIVLRVLTKEAATVMPAAVAFIWIDGINPSTLSAAPGVCVENNFETNNF